MIYLLFQFCHEFTELGWGSRINITPYKHDVIKAKLEQFLKSMGPKNV